MHPIVSLSWVQEENQEKMKWEYNEIRPLQT